MRLPSGAPWVLGRTATRPRRVVASALACTVLGAGCGADPEAPPPRVVSVSAAPGGLVARASTGVALRDGRVLTVAHAVRGGDGIEVAGRPARVLRASERLDLAVLAVPGVRAPAARVGGEARAVRLAVLRHGVPRTLTASVRRRVAVRFREQPGDPARMRPGLELAAHVDPGDSGAPVLDRRGRLLGILYARSHGDGDTAWAVDASAPATLLAG